jgi:hypothetical protein
MNQVAKILGKRGDGHVRYDDLTPVPGFDNVNPLFLLRDALAKCPDQYPSKATSELLFVEPSYRDVLRLDISEVNQASADSIIVKMAVFAPMPSASERTAIAVNPGVLRSTLAA